MRRALVAAAAVLALAAGPARANAMLCEMSGKSGEFQIRKLTLAQDSPSPRLSMAVTFPEWVVTDRSNYHMFGGIWILRASDLANSSFGFIDASAVAGPPYVRVTFGDADIVSRDVPSTDEIVEDRLQGAYTIAPSLWADTYYVISFGEGGGTWRGTLDLWSNGDIDCPLVDIPGEVRTFNASDFTGGTQVEVPGYGHAENARLVWSNPRPHTVGAWYAYEPAPFPPAEIELVTEDWTWRSKNEIIAVDTTVQSWDLTLNYTGKTDTILIELLQLDLLPAGDSP